MQFLEPLLQANVKKMLGFLFWLFQFLSVGFSKKSISLAHLNYDRLDFSDRSIDRNDIRWTGFQILWETSLSILSILLSCTIIKQNNMNFIFVYICYSLIMVKRILKAYALPLLRDVHKKFLIRDVHKDFLMLMHNLGTLLRETAKYLFVFLFWLIQL